MSGSRKSGEEHLRKKAKVSKYSSKSDSDKALGKGGLDLSKKQVSYSSADAGKAKIQDKAKIQEKDGASSAFEPKDLGSKVKIQDKAFEAPSEAEIQDKEGNVTAAQDRLRGILGLPEEGELIIHSAYELMAGEFFPFEFDPKNPVTFESTEVPSPPSISCDEVSAHTFVMSAQAAQPFVAATEQVRLPQVEEELVKQGGDALYKSLISALVQRVHNLWLSEAYTTAVVKRAFAILDVMSRAMASA
ncbi:hypothetical protein EJB05_04522, partial [Eragrostis curvula]